MTIAEKLLRTKSDFDEVYSAGYEKGRSEGDSWYDTFWDGYQQNGERTHYNDAFNGKGWNDLTFKPKYDLVVSSAQSMFANSQITDLVAILNKQGIYLSFIAGDYGYSDLRYMFEKSTVTHVPTIDATYCRSSWVNSWFADCTQLETIDKLILPDVKATYINVFKNCSALKNVVFEGKFYQNVDLKSSPLTAESAKSAISCFENYAGTENEYTYTITFSSITWGYLDVEGNASPNGNSWREYINDLGWNVS